MRHCLCSVAEAGTKLFLSIASILRLHPIRFVKLHFSGLFAFRLAASAGFRFIGQNTLLFPNKLLIFFFFFGSAKSERASMPKTQKRSGPGIFPVRQNGITSFRTPRCTKNCKCVYIWNLSDFLLHSINSAFHSPTNSLRISCTSAIFPISRSPTVALEFCAVAPHAGHLGFFFQQTH